jgi:hypothetical protein
VRRSPLSWFLSLPCLQQGTMEAVVKSEARVGVLKDEGSSEEEEEKVKEKETVCH